MSDYDIEISRFVKQSKNGSQKTEIWTKLIHRKTCETISKRIWWEDDKGIYHDGTKELPVEVRKEIDNIWIEKSRKW